MRIGITFPQLEIGTDPEVIKECVQAAEDLGYDHLTIYDHVLGANTAAHASRNIRWPYDHTSQFHEPMVLYGFIAACTRRIELNTAVMVLGQRQTVLFAKQAAEVDVLTKGRLRLGIGTGWNPVEYEGLGEEFENRGARSEEQVAVLRALWTNEIVTFQGRWHKITAAGLNPLPVQRPIPIWIGGFADAVLRRIARIGDGCFPIRPPDEKAQEFLDRLYRYTKEAGRDPSAVGVEARVGLNFGRIVGQRVQAETRPPEDCVDEALSWGRIGATHVTLNTMDAGLSSPDAHIDAMRRFKEAMARS